MDKIIYISILIWVVPPAQVDGQAVPQKGVVWEMPAEPGRAASDLRTMRNAGVEAVRSGIIRDDAVLTLADTLGVDLYLELPLSDLPAARLTDTLRYATAVLDTLIGLAHIHGSIRNIGLARSSDTSDSTACVYFDRLAARVRQTAPQGTRAYYVTRFIESDRCAATVDFVLADVRDTYAPADPLRRWSAAHPSGPPIGVAATGVPVRPDSLRGLDVPASPERQARYFENHLPVLLAETLPARPPVVFVYRWKDHVRRHASLAYDVKRPFVDRYGLHTLGGTPRPAFEVVAGVFTGRQFVFAFEQVGAVPQRAPWTTLLGWGVVVMLGIFYALSPRFRHMVPRYFQAHFFFREAVREGRDVLIGASAILLVSLGAAAGLIAYVVVEATRRTYALAMAVRWLPETAQTMLVTLVAQPLVLVLVVGCVYVIGLLIWTLVLSLLTRRRYRIAPTQTLMLVVWPRWPLLIVMVAAVVIAATPNPIVEAVLVLAATWLVIILAAAVRTLYDLMAVARMPFYLLIPAVVLHPLFVLTAALAVALLPVGPELTFLWHAVTRT